MAKQNEGLFEESSQGSVSAMTGVVFIVSLVLVVGGMVLLSYGFNPTLAPMQELAIFFGGILATTIGFIFPFWVLPKFEK